MTNRERHRMHGRASTAVLSHALVLIAALGAGYWVGGRTIHESEPVTSVALGSTGIIPRESPLHAALEQLPAGAERTIEPGLNVKPIVSYGAMSGVWCRRFELRAWTGRTEAVACRGQEEWRIAALVTGPNEIDGDDRSVAEGNVIIDAAVAATIEGEPLDLQEELEVLVHGWAPEPER